jgi:small-conductance mechanosensitive channel
VADKETEDENKAVKEIERLAREQAKKEAEETKKAKELGVKSEREAEAAEKKAKKEAEKLAREKAKKEAEEAKRAKKEAERLAKEQAKQDKQDKKGKKEVVQDISPATSEGNFQLVLPSSVGFKQLKQFTDHLAGVKDLKIVWTGGSTDEGILIAVSVAQAVPLAQILSEMPMVEGVEVKGEKITITPKGPA